MKKFISSLLALIMVMSLFSGIVIFGANATDGFDDSIYTYVQIPGVQDWDDETIATYNEVTASGAKLSGTTASIVNTHTKGNATQAIKLSLDGTPNAWSATFSTKADPDDQVQSQLGNVYGDYTTFKGIASFSGIRVAIVNENGERPVLKTSDEAADLYVSFRFVGTESNSYGASWANGCVPWLTGTYYEAKKDGSAIAESEAVVYHDGYYYFTFDDFKSGWGGSMRDQYTSGEWNWMWKYSNMYMTINATSGFNSANTNGGALYISDMQFFSVKPVDKTQLEKYINGITELDTENKYSAELEAASAVFNNSKATQAQVDAQVGILEPIYNKLYSPFDPFKGYTYTQLPGIQDWDDELLTQYNAQSNEKVNGTSGTAGELVTTHVKGEATKALKLNLTSPSIPNDWTISFSTCGNAAAREEASQLGNVLGTYNTPSILNQYSGIRIAVENEYGNEPNFNTWDKESKQEITFRFVGSGSQCWNNTSRPYSTCRTYYRNSDETLANTAVYHDGYYYFYFKDFNSGWNGQGKFFEYHKNNNNQYGNIYFALSNGGLNNPQYNGGAIYISDMQLFTAPLEYTRENLEAVLAEATALDVLNLYSEELAEAKAVADSASSTSAQYGEQMEVLYTIIAALEESVAAAKTEINDLLNTADELGLYTATNEYYDDFLAADIAITDSTSTPVDILTSLAKMREIMAKHVFGEQLAAAMTDYYNVWKYNYSSASYAALVDVAEKAWAQDSALDETELAASIAEAIANLEPVTVVSSQENWFENWTTEDVNAVVEENSDKLVDSIGDGLNKENVWNAGDFSNNTVFTAENGAFSMKATADFTGKSMGWKNMDRSGNLADGSGAAFPVLNFTSISEYEGIRIKLNVTDGSAERLLIGLSNCYDMSREIYALNIKPGYADADGYINIPFEYFDTAWWAKDFSAENIDSTIVFIIEAYGVTNGTTVTVSDVSAYKTVNIDERKLELYSLVDSLAKYQEDRFAEAFTFANSVIDNDDASDEDIAAAVRVMNGVKNAVTYTGNDTYYYDAVSVPMFQEWTDDDCTTHNSVSSQSSVSISDKSLIGDATQSILAQSVTENKFLVSNCDGGASINTAPKIGDPFKGYYSDFGKYDGMRLAIANKYGIAPILPDDASITFKLHGNYDASGPVPTFTVTLSGDDLSFADGYVYFDFEEMLPNWSSSKNFNLIAYSSWYLRYQLFEITVSGTGISSLNDGGLYFSDFQLYTQNEIVPRDNLIELIEKVKNADTDELYSFELEAAQFICDDITSTEEDIAEAVAMLSEIYLTLSNDNGNFNSDDIVASFGAVADPKEKASEGTVKLLMIGNSFSRNAFNYIRQIAEKEDIDLVVANLNIGGCNLERHYKCLSTDSASYSYQSSWSGEQTEYSFSMALKDADWDYISLQQVSGYAGDYNSYQPYLHDTLEIIREKAPNAEVIWHQTWAYHKDSDHPDFPKYDKDQDKMWAAVESTSKMAAEIEGINYIVPSGKAFQLARASAFGDNLTSDGYHANKYGEYIAGFCFLSTITGVMPTLNSYRPTGATEEEHKLLNDAIITAVSEYGYINYDKNSEYLLTLRALLAASNNSLTGMMVAGNIVTDSTADLNSFKEINLTYLNAPNVMYTLGELDLATNKNAPLVFSTLLADFSKNDLESNSAKRKGYRHFEANGIHILGVPYSSVENGFASYSDEALEWLDAELASITTDMPIFVVTTYPITHTAGSVGASRICSILQKYENVISFSGGVSGTIDSEFIVHYDGFTAVNVGSLSDEEVNAMLVEIDSEGNVRIRRFNITDNSEIKRYVINFDGSNLTDYLEGYYEAPIINLENGATFDLVNGEPSVTWLQDGEMATLNGQPYVCGAPITEAGEYTLTVTAGTLQTTVTFTVIDTRPTYAKGDLDGDEIISVSDALYALRIAAQITVASETDILIGDIDGDGIISVSDALAILRVAAQISDSF